MIELFLYHFAWEYLLPNLNLNLGIKFCVLSIDQRHTDTLIRRKRVIACRHLTNGNASLIENSVSMTRNRFVEQFDPHEFLGWSF